MDRDPCTGCQVRSPHPRRSRRRRRIRDRGSRGRRSGGGARGRHRGRIRRSRRLRPGRPPSRAPGSGRGTSIISKRPGSTRRAARMVASLVGITDLRRVRRVRWVKRVETGPSPPPAPAGGGVPRAAGPDSAALAPAASRTCRSWNTYPAAATSMPATVAKIALTPNWPAVTPTATGTMSWPSRLPLMRTPIAMPRFSGGVAMATQTRVIGWASPSASPATAMTTSSSGTAEGGDEQRQHETGDEHAADDDRGVAEPGKEAAEEQPRNHLRKGEDRRAGRRCLRADPALLTVRRQVRDQQVDRGQGDRPPRSGRGPCRGGAACRRSSIAGSRLRRACGQGAAWRAIPTTTIVAMTAAAAAAPRSAHDGRTAGQRVADDEPHGERTQRVSERGG